MLDQKLFRAAQILALKSLEDPDSEEFYERICRDFSREFHVPLPEVEKLDPFYVTKHWLISVLSGLKNGDDSQAARYEELFGEIIDPAAQEAKKKKDEDWVKQLEQEAALQNVRNALKNKNEPPQTNLEDIPEGLKLPDSGSFGENQ